MFNAIYYKEAESRRETLSSEPTRRKLYGGFYVITVAIIRQWVKPDPEL